MISLSQHLDCMIGLVAAPDKAFYIANMDTQYGIGEDGKKSASRSRLIKQRNGTSLFVKNKHSAEGWDNEIMPVEFWELARVKSEHQLIFGANYIAKNVPYLNIDWGYKPPRRTEYDEFISRNPTGFIIWDKCNGLSDFSDCELIWTSFGEPSFVKKFLWNGMIQAADAENGTIQNGSQSMRIAASCEGWDYHGFETNVRYFNAGCNRYNIFNQQQKLFV